ncbi:hypothetical protein BDV28DRAFT_162980 [Aspergillus coremiiformis]|uniref:Protein kinase domain-containing protein n=1 Tax=Aspergillus coremiiformis TaxID=138285 RepID=A0A5N6YYE9_9EURO|nr:hypothetical protein BDV28DRAFT_162980 [Aspergillus coremiiformis]
MDSAHPQSYHSLYWLVGREIHFPNTDTSWRINEILSEKFRTHHDPEGTIREITSACIATRIEGSSAWEEAIIKTKLHDEISAEAYREIYNLKSLTKRHSTCTPTFIDTVTYYQDDEMSVPGGYIVFILMEKVPGRDLSHLGSLSSEQRDDARLAFIKALWEFSAYGFHHWDPRRQNVVWDEPSKKCYIIDLEDVEDLGVLDSDGLNPRAEFALWSLHGKEEKSPDNHRDDDRMIPDECKQFYSLEDSVINFLVSRVRA